VTVDLQTVDLQTVGAALAPLIGVFDADGLPLTVHLTYSTASH
jgi:hypothetical protein